MNRKNLSRYHILSNMVMFGILGIVIGLCTAMVVVGNSIEMFDILVIYIYILLILMFITLCFQLEINSRRKKNV